MYLLGLCVYARRQNKEFHLSTELNADTAREGLRHATRDAHSVVDEAFGRFDLADALSYRGFLAAHARILPPAEAWLDSHQPEDMRGWAQVRRSPALLADLVALGADTPPQLPFTMDGDIAAVCGVTYVIEGSRLGSAFLSRSVPAEFPRTYLGAPSQSALWRSFLANLDTHLPTPEAIARASDAALRTFAAFRAAGEEAAAA